VTLHDAMADVLRAHGGGWMARDEIAREIASRDSFRRPSDGRHPPSDQLRLRARNYPHLFERSDPAWARIRLRSRDEDAARKQRGDTGARSHPPRRSTAPGAIPAGAPLRSPPKREDSFEPRC
jgi:hypothetical protein